MTDHQRQTLRSALLTVTVICGALIGVTAFYDVQNTVVNAPQPYGWYLAVGIAALVAGLCVRAGGPQGRE